MDQFTRSRIAIVITRDLGQRAGRPGILANIIATLQRRNDAEVFRLPHLFETPSARDLATALTHWISDFVSGGPSPLQCLLYARPSACARLAEQIADGGFDAVYLDTVRCQALLRLLRRRAPHLRIVTDFDDLMSRRMDYLRRNRQPLLTGHVARALPGWLRRIAEGPLARIVTAYEARTLTQAENEAVATSDATVLISPVERRLLQARLPEALRERVLTIPFSLEIRAKPWTVPAPRRFVFIGSDDLLQNRHAIDRLLDLWRQLKPSASLHIFGRQGRANAKVEGVRWRGFVEDLAEVYLPGSIAILPALDSGGIKTKVAEAWAWGCPVLGNDAAFEGFALAGYPLTLAEDVWTPLILNPAAHIALFDRAAQLGSEYVRQNLSGRAVEQAWLNAMRPGPDLSFATVDQAAE